MAYDHEAFWIVVGTAAPVLLVSSVVAIGQALDLAVDEGVAEQPVRSQFGEQVRVHPVFKAALVSAVSVLADFVALLLALIDLASYRDVVEPWAGIVTLAVAVVFLLITLWYALDARIRLRHAVGPPRKSRRGD
jgi:Zn-dependent membrane protease YugP